MLSIVLTHFCDGLTNSLLHQTDFLFALVWLSRPEEALQAVLAPARDNMNVKMRHALADTIVDSHKCSVRLQSRFNRAREKLSVPEERRNQIIREIGESFVVMFRNQQAVAGKHWTVIEKSQRHVIFKYDVRFNLMAGDLAEGAGRIQDVFSASDGFQTLSGAFSGAIFFFVMRLAASSVIMEMPCKPSATSRRTKSWAEAYVRLDASQPRSLITAHRFSVSSLMPFLSQTIF